MRRYIVAIGLAFAGCAAPPMADNNGVATEHAAAEHGTALYPRRPTDASVDGWRYAQWGMTPNQVVSASAGSTSAINVAGFQLTISFMFNGRNDRLVSVLLGKSDCTSDELDKLALLLKLKFGAPFDHYRLEGVGFTIWRWTSSSDLIELTTTKVADKASSTCIISYEPISTAGL
jgi:hypothetical protein